MWNNNYLKIETYCPRESAEKMRLAIWKAWWWHIWNYTYCASFINSLGHFLPMDWANPVLWNVWEIEVVDEIKIEFVCHTDKLWKVVRAIKENHPYEEVWIWSFPIKSN